MKKSSFVALLLGTFSCALFALGMCMALLPEWDAFEPGVALGGAGFLLGAVTVLVWRKMERKPPVRVCGKAVISGLAGIAGVMALGVGMCLCMVWNELIAGIAVGLAGIVVLVCLIPLIRGVRE